MRRGHTASTTDHRTGGSSRPPDHRDEHAPTAPDRPRRTVTASRGTCEMAGPAPRGSRGHGRSARHVSSRPRRGAGSTVGPGSVGTAPASLPARDPARTAADPLVTRSTYRQLLMKGLAPDEAANLTAFLCGIPVGDVHWSLRQVNQLLFLRELE